MWKRILLSLTVIAWLWLPTAVSAAKPTTISSFSAVLYEPVSGRFLYEKAADAPRPMASTTKLMTALVAAEHLPFDRVVTVPPEAVPVEGSSMGLRAEERLSVHDLMAGLLLSSGNDAANTLAVLSCGSLSAFAERMNQKAAALGMKNTVFVTPSGLDEGDHHSTARDMALLGAAVLQNEQVAQLCASRTAVIHKGDPEQAITLYNHNRLLRLYPDSIGLKTGYTVKSGKCLVSAARRNGVTLVAVTLNGGDYWNDHIALYEYGFSVTSSVTPAVPELPFLAVAGGEKTRVALTAESPSPTVLFDGEEVSCRVQLPSFAWAPLTQGDAVGTLTYTVGDRVIQTMDITVAESVAARPPQTGIQKWTKALRRLFAEWLR